MSEQETQAGAEQMQQDKRTLVEDGSEFKGNLVSSCHVVVHGKIEGEVMAPQLTVAESGSVVGDVNAELIRSEGELAGTIEAEELYLSGRVRDETVIRAKSMEVKLSSEGEKYEVTFGACTLAVGDDPRAELQPAAQANGMSKPAQAQAQPTAQAQAEPQTGPQPNEGEQAGVEAEAGALGKEQGRNKRKGKGKREGQVEAAQDGNEAGPVVSTPSNPPPA